MCLGVFHCLTRSIFKMHVLGLGTLLGECRWRHSGSGHDHSYSDNTMHSVQCARKYPLYLISSFLVLSLWYDVPTTDCMRGRSFIVYLNNYLVRKSPHDPRLEYAKQSTDGWWECAPPTPGLSSSSAGHLPQWRHQTDRSLVSNYRWKPVTSGKITHLPGLNEYLPGSWVDNIYYLLDM